MCFVVAAAADAVSEILLHPLKIWNFFRRKKNWQKLCDLAQRLFLFTSYFLLLKWAISAFLSQFKLNRAQQEIMSMNLWMDEWMNKMCTANKEAVMEFSVFFWIAIYVRFQSFCLFNWVNIYFIVLTFIALHLNVM